MISPASDDTGFPVDFEPVPGSINSGDFDGYYRAFGTLLLQWRAKSGNAARTLGINAQSCPEVSSK
jgi:hypothetical protein